MLHLNNINLCWFNWVLLVTFGANDYRDSYTFGYTFGYKTFHLLIKTKFT